jgi:curli biogenesis system outer membrane secretion channel CsgG
VYIVLGKVTSYEENVTTESQGNNTGFNIGVIRVGSNSRTSEKEAYVAKHLELD